MPVSCFEDAPTGYAMPSIAWLCDAIGCLSSRWATGGGPRVLSEADTPPRWEGAVRMVETTFSHIQSTCSPHSVHVRGHVQSTYVDPRTGFPMPGDIRESMAFNAG
jgi:hypothetical protein